MLFDSIDLLALFGVYAGIICISKLVQILTVVRHNDAIRDSTLHEVDYVDKLNSKHSKHNSQHTFRIEHKNVG